MPFLGPQGVCRGFVDTPWCLQRCVRLAQQLETHGGLLGLLRWCKVPVFGTLNPSLDNAVYVT